MFDYLNSQPPIKPKNGDILIFFTDSSVSPLYEIFMTLPTMYPIRHYGIMINDNYYVESRMPGILKWDNITKKLKSGSRIGNINYIRKDWNKGPIGVISTRTSFPQNFTPPIKDYWTIGGCIGTVNHCIKMIHPEHKFCYIPEDFIKQYGKKIGPIII